MSTALADPDVLTRRVREMVGAGRLLAARPLLAALRSMGVAAGETAEIEGRLLLREGRLAEALAVLDAALAETPTPGLHLCRAETRLQADDAAGAAADAAEAVILDRADPQAKAVLGVALIELGRPDEALPCLRSAIAALPDRVAYRQALAAAEERCGDPETAAATLAAAIARAPGQPALRTAAIMLAMRRRDFTTAAALAETARQDGVADACVFGLRGHALSSLGRHAEAAEAYAEALKLAPEDPYVRHLVAASGVLPQALRAPAEYLQTVFDGYASRFEQHLIGLGYRVPGLIRAALLAELDLSAGPVGPVLDLGCGTGLMAVVLSDLALRPLVGVDLSAGMLAEARAKRLYQELVQQDLETFLDAPGPAWPVILAADVFCYFGALDGALARLAARLAPGGLCLFSVELADGEGWHLGRQGRYRHAEAYIRAALAGAGLQPLRCAPEVLRHEADAAVDGLLVVARHAR
ncbi:MAG TPA: methyltransferase domain-containing protein [Acetobacteraceae bacterium]|nr:methyltransferase domain-containing protein [Acetobacteraceae bacterium]